MTHGLRIAWLGPRPKVGGGAPGVARMVLGGLLAGGHRVDCYIAATETSLPDDLRGKPGLEVRWDQPAWSWGTWYARRPTVAFVTSLAARARGFRRLGGQLLDQHRARPYDVLYQFSHIELLGIRPALDDLPPVVLHPSSHAMGHLRDLRDDAPSGGWSDGARQRVARAVYGGRATVQRRDLARAAHVICISRAFRDRLVADYGLDPRRASIVPNPVDTEAFRPAPGGPHPSRPFTILYLSRMSAGKGVGQVVDLSNRLGDLAGEAHIRLLGGHSQWSDQRHLLRGLNPRVARYEGPVAHAELPAILRQADLLIQPSRSEPFALTVAEGLAAGVPVVASDGVGAAEFGGPPAVTVVPFADPRRLERAVRDAIAAPEQSRRHAATRARAIALDSFAPDRVAASIADRLERVVASR